MKKATQPWFIIGIFMLAACMRAPFTSLPSIITQLASAVHQPVASLGILTTIPLICFAVLSTFIPHVSRKWGMELTLLWALIIMAIGSAFRIINYPLLLLGTVLIGIAATVLNVLTPAIITERAPEKIGTLTGMYSFSLTFFSALGAYVISPVTNTFNWQMGINVLTALVVITILIWLPNLRQRGKEPQPTTENATGSLWTNVRAWWLLIFFGFQSFLFYTLVAWLPAITMAGGLSNTDASLVASGFQLFSLPAAFIVPAITPKIQRRYWIVIITGILYLIGFTMLLAPHASLAYYLLTSFILGSGCAAAFGLVITLFGLKTNSPAQTGQLSGMVQAGGYVIAAFGPVVIGNLQAATNWTTALFFAIIVIVVMTGFGILSERHNSINN